MPYPLKSLRIVAIGARRVTNDPRRQVPVHSQRETERDELRATIVWMLLQLIDVEPEALMPLYRAR